jgi:hypothetical protein
LRRLKESTRGKLSVKKDEQQPAEAKPVAKKPAMAAASDEMPSVIDLPLPPSVNRLWRSHRGRVHRAAPYLSWLKAAG